MSKCNTDEVILINSYKGTWRKVIRSYANDKMKSADYYIIKELSEWKPPLPKSKTQT